MKDILLGALGYIPGILMTARRCDDNISEGRNSVKINWSQLLATLALMALSALASSYLMSRDNARDIQNISIAANKMEVQVSTMCDRITSISENLAVIKTRQDERLEREGAQGIRRR